MCVLKNYSHLVLNLKTLKIVSRKSPLARIQAKLVAKAIRNEFPNINLEHTYKSTIGDADLTTPLNKMPDIGVFTNDIRNDLLKGEADIAVHSWKDLPVDIEKGTKISATIDRADTRDMIFIKEESLGKQKLSILSSSPRREKNLSLFLPLALPFKSNISFKDVRGNIHTRLKKLIEGDDDGLVVAKAAIERLVELNDDEFFDDKKELLKIIENLKWMVLPISQNPCAAGQGALAIESREGDSEVDKIMKSINNLSIFDEVEKERSLLKSFGGGCHQKIGVTYETIDSSYLLTIKGETEDGEEISKRELQKDHEDYFKYIDEENYFPLTKDEQKFFDRHPIENSIDSLKQLKNVGIYISRSNAINDSDLIDKSNSIWTSGIETWKSMAKKGYWVNGTSDSLGEDNSLAEDPFRKLDWLKVTHEDNQDDPKKSVATYKLEPLKINQRIKDCDYFYWMSASSFKLALQVFPEIKNKKHACGLGNTHKIIKKEVPEVMTFLSYESWKESNKAHIGPNKHNG